jgi:hypothetical protein
MFFAHLQGPHLYTRSRSLPLHALKLLPSPHSCKSLLQAPEAVEIQILVS